LVILLSLKSFFPNRSNRWGRWRRGWLRFKQPSNPISDETSTRGILYYRWLDHIDHT